MTSKFEAVASGTRATNQKFFANDIYISTTQTDARWMYP
jgi:hypothetical protein